MGKKSVPHNSTESEVVSLDAGLRMDGLLALGSWDVVIEALHFSKNTESPTREAQVNLFEIPTRNTKEKGSETLMNCQMWSMLSQTQVLLEANLSCTFLKTMKRRSK